MKDENKQKLGKQNIWDSEDKFDTVGEKGNDDRRTGEATGLHRSFHNSVFDADRRAIYAAQGPKIPDAEAVAEQKLSDIPAAPKKIRKRKTKKVSKRSLS